MPCRHDNIYRIVACKLVLTLTLTLETTLTHTDIQPVTNVIYCTVACKLHISHLTAITL